MKTQYKPILVFYIKKDRMHEEEKKKIEKFAELKGYEVLLFQCDDFAVERVEIISVDKATKVKDINKYLDEVLKGEGK